jgi:hypothetical protein
MSANLMKDKLCAYCGDVGLLTKEHVIPDFLYKLCPDQKFGYNPRADQFISWEAMLRDVCGKCNNERLSSLDAYGKDFYINNHLEREFLSPRIVQIRYDYDLLLRWLLKISYNAIRFAGGFSDPIKQSVPYILSGVNKPRTTYLYVEIVKNYKIKEKDRIYLPLETRDWDSIPPNIFRVGWVNVNTNVQFVGRYIAINSYFFYLFLFSSDSPPSEQRQVIKAFQSTVGKAALLNPSRQVISVSVSNRTCLDAYVDQAMMLKNKWEKFRGKINT